MSKRTYGHVLVLPSRLLVRPATDDEFVTKILKVKICFFKKKKKKKKSVPSSRSENTGAATRDHVRSSQMRNETPVQL